MFEDFYGLRGRPFQLTPDPAFYYESLTHRKALSYLGYGLGQSEGFVVITGEVGAGKSTLVAHLLATIDPGRLTAAQVATGRLGGEELVSSVAQAFGLDIESLDKPAVIGAIESFLHEEARAGRRCLLIVDEAQALSIEALEELRLLSNFQLGSHPLLQTLLLGQPEFRVTLLEHPDLEQLRQRVIATHHLEAMEPGEVQAYVEHRLTCAGWTGNPAFDSAVFADIHLASGGIPRRINQIANRLLLLGAVEEAGSLDGAMLAQAVAELAGDAAVSSTRQPVMMPDGQSDGVSPAQMADALAKRDARIAELQQALIELAGHVEMRSPAGAEGGAQDLAWMQERIDVLEGRLIEQDRTIRHTLTMLIEWIEADQAPRAVA